MLKINRKLVPTQYDYYSSDEIKTNKVWRNGKPIYRKIVNMGTLNNATGKTVSHGISNIDEFTFVYGEANNGYTWVKDAGFNDELYWSKTTFTWNTKTNRTAFTAFITAEYTKTTD